MDKLFHAQGWDFHLKDIVEYGTAVRLRGFLKEDVLYLTDPEGLRHILTRDHEDIYDEPPMIIERNKLLWGHGLLSSTGSAHRKQRHALNPAFSTSRLSDVLPIFYAITHKLEDRLVEILRFGPAEIDMLVWMSRVSLELIGQAGIGVSFDNLTADSPPNKYMVAAKQLIPLAFPLQGFMRLIPYIVKLGSPRLRGFLAGIAPHPNIRKLKEIIYFLYETNSSVYRNRLDDLSKGDDAAKTMIGNGKDIISILIKENAALPQTERLTDDEMISTIGTLVFAGQDTTSVALSRILHTLALDQERQQKLRQELQQSLSHDYLFKDLMDLQYLDAVCKETLRVYSPVTQLHRVPRKDAVIPLCRPVRGKNGTPIEKVMVQAGTMVVVGAAAVNRDPLIWGPDAHLWRPERWLEPMLTSTTDARLPGVYSNIMSFMGGGRSCIGFRFAEMEIKVILSILIPRFKFEISDKDIVWKMFNFATPTVHDTPSLPLQVTYLG